jgi:hypothetical protein
MKYFHLWSDREIDELFLHYYSHFPHYREIQEAIWKLFENQDHLWTSDIKTIAANLSLNVTVVRGYLSLITDSDNKPKLLAQLFYEIDENGQLKLIEFSPEELFALVLASIEAIKPKTENKLAQKGTIDWFKSRFTCWQPIGKAYKPILDSSFNSPSNSLWADLQRTNF